MKQLLDGYKVLKNQKEFLKIIYANIINRFGDSIDAIAFTWLVYALTGSPVWSTIIFGINMMPTILIQPFAGALVEKMHKKRIMVICDMLRGIFVSITALCYVLHVLSPWTLLVMTILNSTVEALRVPAGMAIVPHLLDKDKYDKGIALNSSLSRALELIGTACAGVIIGVFGVAIAILIDAITFFGSAMIIALIKYEEKIGEVKISVHSYLITLKEGIHYIRQKQIVLILCFVAAFINFMLVPINSFLPIYIDEVMKAGSETLSLLSMGITIGSILGSFFYPIITNYITKRKLLLYTIGYIGCFLVASMLLPNYIAPSIYLNIVIFLLYLGLGFFAAAASTFASVLLTSGVEPEFLARVGAVFGAFATLMIPIGSMLTTCLLQFLSFKEITILFGVSSILICIIMCMIKAIYLLDQKNS